MFEGKIEIMDVKGKLLYSLEVNKYKTSFEVDIKDFNSGLYLVKYKSKTGTVNIEKLIISK